MREEETVYFGLGRRKSAIARIRITKGSGRIKVNGREIGDYFPTPGARNTAIQPLYATKTQDRYDVTVKLTGGGYKGQAGAMLLGVSRALAKADATLKPILRDEGFFTRDPRMRERKKYGQKGARARYQFSKR